ERNRTDPEFLRRLDAIGPTYDERRRIFDALGGTAATSGANHLAALTTLLDSGSAAIDEVVLALGRLDQAESTTLRGQPALVNRIITMVRYDERALAQVRAMLSFDPSATQGSLGVVGANFATNPVPGEITPEERTRLAYLQHQADSLIRGGAYRSFEALLPEAVTVYKMDLRPVGANPPATAAAAPAVTPAGETRAATADRLQRHTPAETHALEIRSQVWTDALRDVVHECVYRDGVDEATKQRRMLAIENAVRGTQDPSGELLTLVGAGTWASRADQQPVIDAINNASPQIIITSWSSVMQRAYGNAPTLVEVYERYRTLRDSHDATPAHEAQVNEARVAVQRYAILPSLVFERAVLSGTGSFFSGNDTTPTTTADQNHTRDNSMYPALRDALYTRISGLDHGLIARQIGAEGADDAMIDSGVRAAEQGLAQRSEAHDQQRAGGSQSIDVDDARQMDRDLGDYHRAVQGAEDATAGDQRGADGNFADISARDQRDIAHIDADFVAHRAAFQQARQQAADNAAMIVGVLVGVILAVLVPGPGTAAGLAFYSAMVSAAAATGQVLTREAILGNTYDAGGDGLKTIAAAAATGAIAGGAQYYSGQIVNALMPLGSGATASAQATALASGLNAGTAPAWQTIVREGGRSAMQTSFTGFANTVGSVIDPNNWLHGWNEGWYRARDAGAAQIRALPGAMVRAALTGMATSAAGQALHTAGVTPPAPAGVGESAGVDRVAAQIAHDLPGNVAAGVADQTMSALLHGGPTTPGAFLQGVLASVAQSTQDMAQSTMAGSIPNTHYTQQQRIHVGREIAAHHNDFVAGDECALFYNAVIATPEGMALPTGAEFLAARNTIAGAHAAGVALTPAQREAFQHYVREGRGPDFQARALRNPLEIPAVASAATPPVLAPPAAPTTARGREALTHATEAQTAATALRAAMTDTDRADVAYLAQATPAQAQDSLARMATSVEAGRAAVERARAARDAIQHALAAATDPAERAEIQAQLDVVTRVLAEAEANYQTIALTRARLTNIANAPPPAAPPGSAPATDPASPHAPTAPEVQVNNLSPENYLLLHSLIEQHGHADGTRRFLEQQRLRSDRATGGDEITASMIQGSDFVGSSAPRITDPAALATQQAQLVAASGGQLLGLVDLLPGVARIDPDGTNFRVTLRAGGTFLVRVSTTQLPPTVVARSLPNTERGIHNIQLNDTITLANLRRALAHEVAELAAIQERQLSGAPPRTADALIAERTTLGSPLGAAAAPAPLRREIAALIENLGLREGTAGAAERMALIRPNLTPEAQREVGLLARPRGQLDTPDQQALDQIATRSALQQSMVDQAAARARELHPAGEVPVADRPDGRVSLARAEAMAASARTARIRRAAEVVTWLRGLVAAPGEPHQRAPLHILIGGGAAAASLTSDTLFIDDVGRWHVDESGRIAQTTQQLGAMPGLGDARQFATAD
ncbi:MAG: hypothetical protein NT062_21045, partial [Proteobacteria bacterium]|nr:hypothetical protein [Pseudomonadota bacterium]